MSKYFKNEHGFYSDDITKRQAYFVQLPQLFRQSISKSSEGLLLYNGNSISGMVGNAEMGFFSVGHTVYRYHVKFKVIDKLFTEERMESFYPISSHVILWKRAEENKKKATLMDKKNDGAGVDVYKRQLDDGAGKVGGIRCVEMELGEPDESGRRRPVEKKGSEFEIEVDSVIMAIGTSPNLSLIHI